MEPIANERNFYLTPAFKFFNHYPMMNITFCNIFFIILCLDILIQMRDMSMTGQLVFDKLQGEIALA